MPDLIRHADDFKTLAQIQTPRTTRVLGYGFLLLTIGIALFLTYAPWVQTSPGTGSVTALSPNDRVQEITALVSGRLQEWYVRDGSHVKMGDPIVRLIDNDPQLLERLQSEREQVIAKLAAQQTALDIAEIDRDRMADLFDQGLAARRDMELARIKVEELRSKVAEVAGELNRVEVNLSRQSMQIVKAPRDGTILKVNAGDTATLVSAGDPLATFVPDNAERVLELFIPGRDVALVRIGAKVRIQFEGWPILQISGWPSTAVGTFGGEVIAIDPSAQPNGRFRVLVAEDTEASHPWPSPDYVRFGSTARGWVLLQTVSAGYEIWRQLNNFPPEFPEGSKPSSGSAP
ncbi:MAG: HlyD family efflux transporter periplasmic adaptor subunit [Halieaceae bacterium]|jgi:multidrug efflux pump subunit AcrA (membrane-fusion protein)|nr:HlyD family efflux transporter periplasmic adaptor subunit [Halieaceae bacterium]